MTGVLSVIRCTLAATQRRCSSGMNSAEQRPTGRSDSPLRERQLQQCAVSLRVLCIWRAGSHDCVILGVDSALVRIKLPLCEARKDDSVHLVVMVLNESKGLGKGNTGRLLQGVPKNTSANPTKGHGTQPMMTKQRETGLITSMQLIWSPTDRTSSVKNESRRKIVSFSNASRPCRTAVKRGTLAEQLRPCGFMNRPVNATSTHAALIHCIHNSIHLKPNHAVAAKVNLIQDVHVRWLHGFESSPRNRCFHAASPTSHRCAICSTPLFERQTEQGRFLIRALP
mmetsp:Transcript_12701/g.14592  ORF Transcript_12701/g.14592 Transcript_12701/m.14592 type:complete len:283 (-) Transcript_12701:433-1281(-)